MLQHPLSSRGGISVQREYSSCACSKIKVVQLELSKITFLYHTHAALPLQLGAAAAGSCCAPRHPQGTPETAGGVESSAPCPRG